MNNQPNEIKNISLTALLQNNPFNEKNEENKLIENEKSELTKNKENKLTQNEEIELFNECVDDAIKNIIKDIIKDYIQDHILKSKNIDDLYNSKYDQHNAILYLASDPKTKINFNIMFDKYIKKYSS